MGLFAFQVAAPSAVRSVPVCATSPFNYRELYLPGFHRKAYDIIILHCDNASLEAGGTRSIVLLLLKNDSVFWKDLWTDYLSRQM